ncbi:hypothetical protein KCU73_g104, partial [Aureobasidium melanogenum]
MPNLALPLLLFLCSAMASLLSSILSISSSSASTTRVSPSNPSNARESNSPRTTLPAPVIPIPWQKRYLHPYRPTSIRLKILVLISRLAAGAEEAETSSAMEMASSKVRIADFEVFSSQAQVAKTEILHAEEELRKMSTLEQAGGCRVGRDGLIMFALCSKSVSKTDPGGPKPSARLFWVFLHTRGRCIGSTDAVEVQGIQELPLFGWRHERILHELVESFEAEDINAYGIFVAVFCAIKGILFCIAETAQVAHGSLETNIAHIFLLVADKNGRLVLVFVQSILSPVAQELFHRVSRFSSYALMKMMLCGSDAR